MPPVATRYDSVWIHGADCQSPAGDAAATWAAVAAGRHALLLDAEWGWLGPIADAGDCTDLAARAAAAPWAALGERRDRGWPALVTSISKGDTGAWLGGPQPDAQRMVAGLPGMLPQALARRLGIRHWLGAPPVAACATGLLAILEAADCLHRGLASHALCGAADRSLQPLLLGGFRSLGVCCGDTLPQAHSGHATGFAAAEGAGMLALAAEPGPWRLVGGLRLGDASHETRCDDPAVLRACLEGLWDLLPEPDAIIAHGTGTRAGDALEVAGLETGPWRHCRRICCKPIIGHSLGANAVVELAAGLQSPYKRLWKLALGFGGHIAAVAVEGR